MCHRYWIVAIRPTKLVVFFHLSVFLKSVVWGEVYLLRYRRVILWKTLSRMELWTGYLMSKNVAVQVCVCPRAHIKSQHGATCACNLDTKLALCSLKALFWQWTWLKKQNRTPAIPLWPSYVHVCTYRLKGIHKPHTNILLHIHTA